MRRRAHEHCTALRVRARDLAIHIFAIASQREGFTGLAGIDKRRGG
jgi:hypothetical protein